MALRIIFGALTTASVFTALFGSWMEFTAVKQPVLIAYRPAHQMEGDMTYALSFSTTSWLIQDAAAFSVMALIASCVAVWQRRAVSSIIAGVLYVLTAVQALQGFLFFSRAFWWLNEQPKLQFEGTFYYGFGFAVSASVFAAVCAALEFNAASKADGAREPELDGEAAKQAKLELPA